MARQREKHMPFFGVLEALQKAAGCPLCEMDLADTRRYLESVLYEPVNDPVVRAELVKSRGYCRRHAHVILSFKDGLGTAILYRDQVKLFLERLGKMKSLLSVARRKRLPDDWGHHAACPACRMQAADRNRHIVTLLEWLDDADMRAAFDASLPLCVPHFSLVIKCVSDAGLRRYLIEVEHRKMSKLAADLDEFVRRNDYHFVGKGFAGTEKSPADAVRLMVGLEGILDE